MTEGAVIAGIDARAYATRAHLNDDELILSMLPWATAYASPPVSGFKVGAVALGRSGNYYAGGNLELPGLPLSGSVHAEQAVVANARLYGERELLALATTATPCGHCRQFLNELRGASGLRILVRGSAAMTLSDLLPARFGPSDLGVEAALLEPVSHGLRSIAGAGDTEGGADALMQAALAAADGSYAPYTKTYAGAAVRTAAGRIASGGYLESAAFNPSLPALQAALVALVLRRERPDAILDAVLVEASGPASQRSAAASAIEALAGIPLRYVRAEPAAPSEPGMGLGE